MSNYTWIPIYKELSVKLLEFENRQSDLLDIIKKIASTGIPMIPIQDKHSATETAELTEIDPFTFYSCFNRGITNDNRKQILAELKDLFNLKSDLPDDFDGIPVMTNQKSWFFAYKYDRGEKDIKLLWKLFREAVTSEITESTFNSVLNIKGVRINITIGLFWIMPDKYLSLDSVMKEYSGIDFDRLDYNKYYEVMNIIKQKFSGSSFEAISFDAWISKGNNSSGKANYWIFHCNPDYWNSKKELQKYSTGKFRINKKYENEIKPGDKFGLWISGSEAGIYSFGEITSLPAILKDDEERIKEFASKPEDFEEGTLSVELKYTERFPDKPLLRNEILKNGILKDKVTLF